MFKQFYSIFIPLQTQTIKPFLQSKMDPNIQQYAIWYSIKNEISLVLFISYHSISKPILKRNKTVYDSKSRRPCAIWNSKPRQWEIWCNPHLHFLTLTVPHISLRKTIFLTAVKKKTYRLTEMFFSCDINPVDINCLSLPFLKAASSQFDFNMPIVVRLPLKP